MLLCMHEFNHKIEHSHDNLLTMPAASAHYTSSQFGEGVRPFVYIFVCNGYEEDIHFCRNISYGSFWCTRESAAGVRCHHGSYQNEK